MASKRSFHGDDGFGVLVPEPKRRLTFKNIVFDVMKGISHNELASRMETSIRKVVREEVERVVLTLFHPNSRLSFNHDETSRGRFLQLLFENKLPSPIYTGSKIEAEDGEPVKIVLIDPVSRTKVTSGPHSSMKIEILVLDGDFGFDDREDWTQREFNAKIVKERDGKCPLVKGDLNITLKDGVGIVFSSLSTKTITPLPPIPPRITQVPSISRPPPSPANSQYSQSEFQEKMLYLDSIGIDFFSLINDHPPIIFVSLADIKSTVDLMSSMDFTAAEFSRIVSMCPEILTSRASDVLPVFTFLLREAKVNGSDLKRVINRRPRLLVCAVKTRLRPTLYFLQSMGIAEVNKHTYLLSCSVEDKFFPRIQYFQKIGFSKKETTAMFRRFPQLFNYSIKENYEPKLNYFVVEMGRDLKELIKFPQYFSFSLKNRIKPRHQACVEKGVCFPLNVLLKTSEEQFRLRLDVCCNSSMPLSGSPLSRIECHIDSM